MATLSQVLMSLMVGVDGDAKGEVEEKNWAGSVGVGEWRGWRSRNWGTLTLHTTFSEDKIEFELSLSDGDLCDTDSACDYGDGDDHKWG
ncbi:adenylate cyclase [Sesbania bispinosa]|nr:adenylate cyclase [Sesbania bispinosa]